MSMSSMHKCCMTVDISCYTMRVFFCFKPKSTDFLIFRLTIKDMGYVTQKQEGSQTVHSSCKTPIFFPAFCSTRSSPLSHLSFSKLYGCLVQFLTEHEMPSHACGVPDCVFIANSMLESHFSLAQRCQVLPLYLCARINK